MTFFSRERLRKATVTTRCVRMSLPGTRHFVKRQKFHTSRLVVRLQSERRFQLKHNVI